MQRTKKCFEKSSPSAFNSLYFSLVVLGCFCGSEQFFLQRTKKLLVTFKNSSLCFHFAFLVTLVFPWRLWMFFFVSSLRLLLWKNKVFSVSYGHGVGCWNSVSQTLASRRDSLILFGRFSFVGKKFIRRPQQPNLFPAAFSLCTNPLFLSPHTEHVWWEKWERYWMLMDIDGARRSGFFGVPLTVVSA